MAAVGYTNAVLADNPIEYWKLEESSGDFLTSAVGGNSATPNGTAHNGIASRGVAAAICNGIISISGEPVRQIFAVQRPFDPDLFVDNWVIEQIVSPTEETAATDPTSPNGLNSTDKMLVVPRHGDDWGADQIGIGVQVGTNGVVVRQHGGSNLHVASTFLMTDIMPAGTYHHVVVKCTLSGVRRTIRIYIDGIYAGDIVGGTYNEWFVDNVIVGTWPRYGQTNLNVSLSHYYGFSYAGGIDEVAWYNYPLSDARILAHAQAILGATTTLPGDFTNPLGGETFTDAFLVTWGAATVADGYLLELWNGVEWSDLATTTDPEYFYNPGLITVENYRFRVTPLMNGYGPDPCDPKIVYSNFFNIAIPEPPEPPVDDDVTPCISIDPIISNNESAPEDIPQYMGEGCGIEVLPDVSGSPMSDENTGVGIVFNPCP